MSDDPKRPQYRWRIALIGVWLAALLILPPPYNSLVLWATLCAGIGLLVWQISEERKRRFFARLVPAARFVRAVWDVVLPFASDLPTINVMPARIRYRPLLLGLVILVVLAEINGNLLRVPLLQQVSFHVQFVMLCAGIGLVAWGLIGRRTPPAKSPVATSYGSPLKQADFGKSLLAPAIFRWLTPKSSRMTSSIRRFPASRSVYLIAFITILAFGLRVWQLEESLRAWVDENNFSLQVLRFVQQPYTAILARSDPQMSFPRLYVYGQYLSVSLLGRSLEGLRFLSVLVGTLTIPAVYVLGRRWFDRRTALVTALLLATFPPHLQFSRIGLNNVADPLVGTLLLAVLARLTPPRRVLPSIGRQHPTPSPLRREGEQNVVGTGMMNHAPTNGDGISGLHQGHLGLMGEHEKHITRADLVLVGILLGLTQYFYEAGRYVFPALALVCLGTLWLRGKLAWRDLRLLLLVALIVAAPVYYAIFAARLPFTPRLNETSSLDLPYLPRLLTSLSVYVSQPDMRLFIYYYGGQTALVLPALVPLFLGGVAYALRWMRRWPGLLLLLLWLAFTSLGNSFLIVPGVYARYVVAFPALALLTAVGLCYALPGVVGWIYSVGGRGDGRRRRFAMGVPWNTPTTLIIALALTIAAGQAVYYFGAHLPGYMAQIRREYGAYDVDDALLRAADLPDGTLVLFINQYPPDALTLRLQLMFLNSRVRVDTIPLNRADEYFSTLDDAPLAFFVAPHDLDTLALLRTYYRLEGPYYSHRVPLNRQYLLYLLQP